MRNKVQAAFHFPKNPMWHIILIGYIFVTLMFSVAQPSLARALIYLVFWTVLPTLFAFWATYIRLRNRRLKREETQPTNKEPNHDHPRTPD